jgi:uncharacterized protein involved in exopolysaccharide biosynthesis
MSNYVDMSSGGVMRGLRGHWRLLLVCALVGLALAGGRLLMQGTSYSAQSQVLVGQPLTLASLTSASASNIDQARLVDFTQRLIKSETLAGPVEKQLDVDKGDYTLDVLSANATSMIGLRVTAADPDQARDIANAYAQGYVAWVTTENQARVDKAVKHLRKDIKGVAGKLEKLDQQVADAPQPGAAAVALAPQRTVLVQQQVALETRLSQAQLVGAVDAAGGGQVVERAVSGEVSTFAAAGPLVIGALFGLLIGAGIAALRESRTGRTASGAGDRAGDHAGDHAGDRRADRAADAPVVHRSTSNGLNGTTPSAAEPAGV